MRHASKLSFVFFLAVCAGQARAYAQPAAETTVDAASVRADDLAHRGNDFALKDKWAEAEALFQQAWALKQSYDIGGNLGIAEQALGKHRDAAEHLSFALTHFPANGKAEHRELLREQLAKVRAKVGTRTIEVSVAGAEVLVDGTSVGVAPLPSEVFLAPGTRTVEARLAGYATARRTVEVVAGSSEAVALELRLLGSTGGETTPPIVKRPTWPVIVAGGAAVVALGVGTGLAVAANGKRSDFDALGMTVGNGAACAGTPAASLAMNCQALKNDAASHDSLTKGALGGFVAGGVLAATAVGLGVWATGRRSPTAERTGVRMVPLLGRGEAGLGVAGAW